MKRKELSKPLLSAILTGSYTPYDLREFVKLCHDLALPLARKKLQTGKLNLSSLRMSESEALYDCLADLFERDEHGYFVQFRNFFEREQIQVGVSSEEFLLESLRRLVFSRLNLGFIRLHSEADPVLGKILHNMDVAVDRSKLLSKVMRFGESYLIPANDDILPGRPVMPEEYIQRSFSQRVVIYDSMPVMLRKLHDVLLEQEEYQRVVSFVGAGLLFKSIYKLAERTEEEKVGAEHSAETADIQGVIERVCRELRTKFYPRYVGKGKLTRERFEMYLAVIRRAMNNGVGEGFERNSLFHSLAADLPGLTKQEYAKHHRSVLEYVNKEAKKSLKRELSQLSATRIP